MTQAAWLILWVMKNYHSYEGYMHHQQCFQDIVAHGPFSNVFYNDPCPKSFLSNAFLDKWGHWHLLVTPPLYIPSDLFNLSTQKTCLLLYFLLDFRGLYIQSKNYKPQEKFLFSWVQGKLLLTFYRWWRKTFFSFS